MFSSDGLLSSPECTTLPGALLPATPVTCMPLDRTPDGMPLRKLGSNDVRYEPAAAPCWPPAPATGAAGAAAGALVVPVTCWVPVVDVGWYRPIPLRMSSGRSINVGMARPS